MKTKELFVGEIQVKLNVIGDSQYSNLKYPYHQVLSNRHRNIWPKKTTIVADKTLVTAMKKTPQTIVNNIISNHA